MKKILLVLLILLLTGCKNQFVCTKKTKEEDYDFSQKLVFTVDKNDKITGADITYVMSFKDEETATAYLNIYESMKEDNEISIDKNEITIKSSKDYTGYEENKETLKEQLEQNAFSCK